MHLLLNLILFSFQCLIIKYTVCNDFSLNQSLMVVYISSALYFLYVWDLKLLFR